jgi:hypothetical protein
MVVNSGDGANVEEEKGCTWVIKSGLIKLLLIILDP